MGSEQGIPFRWKRIFKTSSRRHPCVIGTSTERRGVELAFEQHDLSAFSRCRLPEGVVCGKTGSGSFL